MPSQVTYKMDMREFNEAFRQYMEVTPHAISDVTNKKALYVSRGALRETPLTSKQAITSSLGSITKRNGTIRMSLKTSSGARWNPEDNKQAPLAALIINARRGEAGQLGLQGGAMAQAMQKLINARNRSRAFIKSGWIPAIKILDGVVNERDGASPRGATQYGSAKGGAKPASPGWTVNATIENSASGKHETNEALTKYGGPALQRAVNNEAASMLKFIAERQFKEAKKIGIKVIGG